jgi:O-antigen ligase
VNTVTIKEMLVIVAIAAVVFACAKPVALRFSSAADFSRRRTVWFVLAISAFLSPSFWLWLVLAAPLLVWAGRRDSNPVAFYLLMLFVIPAISIEIPVILINKLFELDIYRVLSFCVLIPAAWRLWRSRSASRWGRLGTMDWLLIGFGALQTALFMPYESGTAALRVAFLFFIDIYVLYYVVSRTCSSRRAIAEAMAALCLACTILAPIAVFEASRHWLLYTDLATQWHGGASTFYYTRLGAVRAEASAGDPLALGYVLAIGFGFWLYLKTQVNSQPLRVMTSLVLWLGLLAAFSRGPWIGAVVIYFVYAALNPRSVSGVFKALGIFALGAGVVALSPLGPRIASVLPFLGGTVDYGSVVYREALLQRSWELFQQHPWLGDPFVLTKMEDLRQGEGIIDLVNTYVQIGLFNGLIGLALFIAFIVHALSKAYRYARRMAPTDPDMALLGASVVACIVGTLVMIGTCSFILAYGKIFYVLGGLAIAYSRLVPAPQPARARAAVAHAAQTSPAFRHISRFPEPR